MNIIPLETLVSLAESIPLACTYAFVNDDTKRFQVYTSTNVTVHLLSLLKRIKEDPKEFLLKEELSNCKLVVLETNDLSRTRQMELISEYESNGYSLYKSYSPIKYSLETEVDHDKRSYCLYAVNAKRNHRILLGVFRKHKTMLRFMDTHYSTGVKRIVKHLSCG